MCLKQRKVNANTDALPGGIGMIGIGMPIRFAFRGPTIGVKLERVLPKIGVAMGIKRRQHHRAARRNRIPIQCIIIHRIARIKRRGWVQT